MLPVESRWREVSRQLDVKQWLSQVSWKGSPNPEITGLVKSLEDCSLSVQDGDRQAPLPLGFQIEHAFPVHQPACSPLLVGTGIPELGEQVVVHGSSWNLTAWSLAQGPGKRNGRTLNYKVFAALFNQCTECSRVEKQHAPLTAGPEAQMLVTEP